MPLSSRNTIHALQILAFFLPQPRFASSSDELPPHLVPSPGSSAAAGSIPSAAELSTHARDDSAPWSPLRSASLLVAVSTGRTHNLAPLPPVEALHGSAELALWSTAVCGLPARRLDRRGVSVEPIVIPTTDALTAYSQGCGNGSLPFSFAEQGDCFLPSFPEPLKPSDSPLHKGSIQPKTTFVTILCETQ